MKRVIPIVLLVVLVGGGILAYTAGWFSDDPDEVSLTEASAVPSAGGSIEDFDGTWTVDNESGSLDAEPPTSTFAGYRIDETFGDVGANTAVGRTQNVEGTMEISGNEITEVDITVDMTSLRSDRDMRDNALRTRGLQTDQFPEATFALTKPISISDEPAEGQKVEVDAVGDFTLHGVTKQVTIPLEALWSGEQIKVVSSFDVNLADYNIERPTTQRVVSIEQTGTVEMQLLLAKSA